MMEVLFFEEANAEIEEGRAWYRRRSEVAEAALLRELNHAIEMVAEAPLRWAKYIAGTRRYVFPTYPYSLRLVVLRSDISYAGSGLGQKGEGRSVQVVTVR